MVTVNTLALHAPVELKLIVEDPAFSVSDALLVAHIVPLVAVEVRVHVPEPMLSVCVAEASEMKNVLVEIVTFGLLVAKSSVPVKPVRINPPAVPPNVNGPALAVTVPPPELASKFNSDVEVGSQEQVAPPVVFDQWAPSVAKSIVPVPPIQKHEPLAALQFAAAAGQQKPHRHNTATSKILILIIIYSNIERAAHARRMCAQRSTGHGR